MNQKQQAPEQLPESTSNKDDSPKFGRLLLVLFCAVALIVFITFATEAYYSN